MSISSISASGMNVAALRQQVAAGNLAGSGVDGAQRQGVVASAQPDGGVSASVVPSDDSGDMIDDLADSSMAELDFQANVTVFGRADDVLGSLLDAFA